MHHLLVRAHARRRDRALRAARGVALARRVDVAAARDVAVPVADHHAIDLVGRGDVHARVAIGVYLDYPLVGDQVPEAVVDIVRFLALRVRPLHHPVGRIVDVGIAGVDVEFSKPSFLR